MKRQIVIEIDEEDYRAIKNKKVAGDLTIPYVFDAIRNGAPLPKGHGKIMDEKEFCRNLRKYYRHDLTPICKAFADTTAIVEIDEEGE